MAEQILMSGSSSATSSEGIQVIKKWFGGLMIAGIAGLFGLPPMAFSQRAPQGDWSMVGNSAEQNGWQKAEKKLTPETAASNFRFLWKINLGTPAKARQGFDEPLLVDRLINAQGFKDIVYVTSSDTLYGVDSELGNLLWKKEFTIQKSACGSPSVSVIMEPPAVINFNARRVPGAPQPAQPPPLPANQRRLGIAPGGGGFGLRGIYALTSDGMLHEQVLTTGVDFAPAVKFLAASATPSALNILGKTIYTATSKGCGAVPGGVSAVNMTTADYPVAHYDLPKGATLEGTGPILGANGTVYVVTGSGPSGSAGDFHASSVMALGSDLKVKDWYTPSEAMSPVTPTIVTYKSRQILVTGGKDGSVALLDAASLGGDDHHTAMSETPALSTKGAKHGWDGLASWQEADGTVWVIASISAPVSVASLKGSAAHGAVVAFRVDDADGKPVLTPVWMSGDMINPAPARIANGVVIALAGGNPASHAKLLALDAKTGKELYSSKETIPTYTNKSGVAVGDAHAFFTDHNNVLYSFGIALEH
jgi:outer membrane protein assembly factor BamB